MQRILESRERKPMKEKVSYIIKTLKELYPDAKCALNYHEPYQLLIATRLSAQCTDKRVNEVTPALFARYPTLNDFAEADFDELCGYIHSCGFFRGKAKSIIEMSRTILSEYNGIVPDSIEELTRLSGVGRKTANLICGDIYGKPAIIADTHCIRISNRLGLAKSTDPVKVEYALKRIIPAEDQTLFCHHLVHHGRAVCMARSPHCAKCPLRSVCGFTAKKSSDTGKKV